MELPGRPISDCYGYDRGTPVDRIYIEHFLNLHRAHIVAEVKDDTYTRRFGGQRVQSVTVIDLDTTSRRADLQIDLSEPGSLPTERFDCILLTQVLQLLPDVPAAIDNCWNALSPGGSLLVTAPCLGRISPSNPTLDRWRFTPAGLSHLFEDWQGSVAVTGYGNLRVALAALIGEAAEDLELADFDIHDPAFRVVATVLAQSAH